MKKHSDSIKTANKKQAQNTRIQKNMNWMRRKQIRMGLRQRDWTRHYMCNGLE